MKKITGIALASFATVSLSAAGFSNGGFEEPETVKKAKSYSAKQYYAANWSFIKNSGNDCGAVVCDNARTGKVAAKLFTKKAKAFPGIYQTFDCQSDSKMTVSLPGNAAVIGKAADTAASVAAHFTPGAVGVIKMEGKIRIRGIVGGHKAIRAGHGAQLQSQLRKVQRLVPGLVIPSGRVMLVRDSQPENAHSPMLASPSGRVMEVRESQE